MKQSSLNKLLLEGSVWNGEKEGNRISLSNFEPNFRIEELSKYLSFGAIHEWSLSKQLLGRHSFYPPLLIFSAILKKHLEKRTSQRMVAWIGKRTWPSLSFLDQLCNHTLWDWKKNTLFINPYSKQERLYALRKSLSSPALMAVVGDASGIKFIGSRQLQLAARTGSTLGLLIRPENELMQSSCAQTKWLVEPIASEFPEWKLTLIKAPGLSIETSFFLNQKENIR